MCAIFGCCSAPIARPQAVDMEKPLQAIDEDISAFAFAPDNRIVYSVRRNVKTKLYDLEHDDIWLQESSGKKRRLLQGDKFRFDNKPFSYQVDSFRWSPSGHLILARLFVTTVTDESGKTQDSFMNLVLDDSGHDVRINGGENVIRDAAQAFWLADSNTVIFMAEALKPKLLYSFQYTNIKTGPAGLAFEGRTFLDAAQIGASNVAIAVEQDRSQSGPPRLQRLDLQAQDDKELAELSGFEGGLSISPSGKKVAYYIDKEVLEVRDLTDLKRVARLRVGMGTYHWSPDERRVLVKRAIEKKTAELVWFDVPDLQEYPAGAEVAVAQPAPQPILRAITFRDFSISPDGRLLGVIAPGKHNLFVFPLTI
jgi:hypothetical protein